MVLSNVMLAMIYHMVLSQQLASLMEISHPYLHFSWSLSVRYYALVALHTVTKIAYIIPVQHVETIPYSGCPLHHMIEIIEDK